MGGSGFHYIADRWPDFRPLTGVVVWLQSDTAASRARAGNKGGLIIQICGQAAIVPQSCAVYKDSLIRVAGWLIVMLQFIVLFLFILIVISLIWGRLKFFRVNTGTTRLTALLYDFSVAIQMGCAIYGFLFVMDITKLLLWFCAMLYILSLVIFWLSIKEAKSLDFAFSDHVGALVTTGTFSIFRHPFYVSYMLAWLASTITFNILYQWITLFYLISFYVVSAKKEEGLILKGTQSESYKNYQQQVGMFIPRIIKWKQ